MKPELGRLVDRAFWGGAEKSIAVGTRPADMGGGVSKTDVWGLAGLDMEVDKSGVNEFDGEFGGGGGDIGVASVSGAGSSTGAAFAAFGFKWKKPLRLVAKLPL